MEGFAIFCLTFILIFIQHFVNWIWRKANKLWKLSEDPFGYVGAVMVTGVAVFITYHRGITLAHWIVEFVKPE